MGSFAEQLMNGVSRMVILRSRSEGRVRLAITPGTVQPVSYTHLDVYKRQIYHSFPDRREGSKSSLILKRTKTKKSNRILYMLSLIHI